MLDILFQRVLVENLGERKFLVDNANEVLEYKLVENFDDTFVKNAALFVKHCLLNLKSKFHFIGFQTLIQGIKLCIQFPDK